MKITLDKTRKTGKYPSSLILEQTKVVSQMLVIACGNLAKTEEAPEREKG